MKNRTATCHCEQLQLDCRGEPVRVSLCHCLLCQKRTGSTYGVQARFSRDDVDVRGRSQSFQRVGDTDSPVTFYFCPDCGSTVYWHPSQDPALLAVAVGAFADPGFPPPTSTIYEERRHDWVCFDENLPLERYD